MATRICWRCGAHSHMAVIPGSFRALRDVDGSEAAWVSEDYRGDLQYPAHVATSCANCAALSIGVGLTTGFANPRELEAEVYGAIQAWEPRRIDRPKYEYVPEPIAERAREAHRCFSVDAFYAAVLLARANIERIAKSNGVTSGSLAVKIDKLGEAGVIAGHLIESSHEVREVGNMAAHGDDEEITRDDAALVLTWMDGVINFVYTAPGSLQEAKAAREAAKPPW